jgi:type IV secretory pathway TraG/TraD family ATPase VirD4
MSGLWDIFFTEPDDGQRASSGAGIFFEDELDALNRHEDAPVAVAFHEEKMFWALRNLPVADAPKHFMVCGTVGSGKTILIKLFLQSIAPRFQKERAEPEQLIVFDAKCDLVPTLAALGYQPTDPNVWLMNPFDERAVVWNIAEAVQQPAMARYLATLLVPEERNSTAPYFSNAAREIVYAVIVALNTRCGSRWTFRDLLCALDSPDHIREVTAHDAHAQRLARLFTEDEKHFPGVLSSLATKLGPFTQVAALWHSRPSSRAFSIQEFLKKPGVLVLGYDPVLNDSLWPINALILKALTNEILRQPDTRHSRHWFVLDEFRAMQNVNCMADLLNRGRSKGASVLLGLQSVEGMMEVYGNNVANEILGLCSYKSFLRAGGPLTAKWAEDFFNKVRATEDVLTEQWGPTGYSHSIQHPVQDRPLFLASVFLDLPFPEKGWMTCINDVPHVKAVTIARRPFPQVLSWLNRDAKVEAIQRRTAVHEQKLEPWSKDEEQYFCRQNEAANGKPSEPGEAKKKPQGPLPKRPKPKTFDDNSQN